MALEHVAQGQTRFFTPGVAPDPRGILLGRFCLMTFATLEGAVSWFRLYSSEASLDELIANLTITKCKTALGSREIVVQIPAVSSYAADRAARLARLVGGAIYTGTAKHFVKYRDDRSPYGYDAVDIGAMPAQTDFMVHGDEFAQGYIREGDLPFAQAAVPAVDPQAARRRPTSIADDRGELYLAVARGLPTASSATCGATASRRRPGLFTPGATSAFDDRGGDRGYMLIRVARAARAHPRAVPRHARHRRVPSRRRERGGRGRLRAPDRSRVVLVGVPAGHVPRVLAGRSRRRAARAARAQRHRAI